MNSDQIQTLVRSILKVGGGILVSKGIADESSAETVAAALAVVIGIVWGWFHRTPPGGSVKIQQGTVGLLIACVFSGALLLGSGCATKLAPDGVYNGDVYLYRAHQAIVSADDLLGDFMAWEAENEAALAQWPEIHTLAEYVRENEPGWIASAIALCDAYKADPSAKNKEALDLALSTLRSVLAEANKYLSAHRQEAPAQAVSQ